MSEEADEYLGVMDAEYAVRRQTAAHLRYRLRVRAKMAVNAFDEFGTIAGDAPRVLELGAAEGLTLLEIRDLLGGEGEYLGVEYAADLIESAPTLPSNVRLIQGDVMDLPEEVPSNYYDLVTELAVLEHLPDAQTGVDEAFRVLAEGGVYVATCPNPFWDHVAGKFGMVEDEYHEGKLKEDVMVGLARRSGFRCVEFRPFMWVVTGALPYVGWSVDPKLSLEIDAMLRRVPGTGFSFVNQALIAVK